MKHRSREGERKLGAKAQTDFSRETQKNKAAHASGVLPSNRAFRHKAKQAALVHEKLIKLQYQIRAGTLFRILPVETSALLMMFFLRSPVFSARALCKGINLASFRKETFERLRICRCFLRTIFKHPAVVLIAHRRIRRREEKELVLCTALRP